MRKQSKRKKPPSREVSSPSIRPVLPPHCDSIHIIGNGDGSIETLQNIAQCLQMSELESNPRVALRALVG